MSRTAFKFAITLAAVGLASCTDASTAVPASTVPAGRNVVPLTGAGFFSSFTPNNNGAEFWDNTSIDGAQCNVGYYVIGTFGPCINPILGSPANAESFGASEFYGKEPAGAEPAPFTFEAGTYEVIFLDGFRGFGREPVGWFTKSGSAYTLNEIDAAVSSVVNGSVTFTSSTPWGFWIRPQEAISGGDGCGVGTMCSDDSQVQQFALFRKPDNSEFLVGIEDQPGVSIAPAGSATSTSFPSGGGDKDFNDFFLSVRKIPVTETLDGRMTGGGTIDLFKKLSVSLTIHCDNKLSNNIQINWKDEANNNRSWHLDKNSLTNIVCQLVADPRPPVAPINIFGGDATGTLDKATGSRLEFKFTDNGEPNRGGDFVALKIWDAGGNVVLDVPNMPLKTGNFQAHFDQPHKNK